MKLNASNELKSRLTHAAANGSAIAADILAEMKRNADISDIIRGAYNYFFNQAQAPELQQLSKNPHRIHHMQQGPGKQEFPRPKQSAGSMVPRKQGGPRTLHVRRDIQKTAGIFRTGTCLLQQCHLCG